MTDFQSELNAAIAERDSLQAELGDAILAGSPTTAIKTKLVKAEAAVEAAEVAQQAISRATQRAAEREEEKAKAAAAAEQAKRWKQAEIDVTELRATVAAKDRLIAKWKELDDREEHQVRALVANYGHAMDSKVRTELSLRGWATQTVQRLKTDSGRGLFMALSKVVTFGVPGKPIADCVPAFARIFPNAPKKAIEHREAA